MGTVKGNLPNVWLPSDNQPWTLKFINVQREEICWGFLPLLKCSLWVTGTLKALFFKIIHKLKMLSIIICRKKHSLVTTKHINNPAREECRAEIFGQPLSPHGDKVTSGWPRFKLNLTLYITNTLLLRLTPISLFTAALTVQKMIVFWINSYWGTVKHFCNLR